MFSREDAPNFMPEYDTHLWEPNYRTVTHVSELLKDIDIVPYKYPQLISEAEAHSDEYMRWEYNRRLFGKRVTGDIETTTGLTLPSTGFEGYYVGKGNPPQKIVRDIADKGNELLDEVAQYLPKSTSVATFKDMLQGKTVPNDRLLWEIANKTFASLILRFRDMAPKVDQPGYEQYTAYRNSVQELVSEAPGMQFEISPSREYTRTLYLPKHSFTVGPSPKKIPELHAYFDSISMNHPIIPDKITVDLTQRQMDGYLMVATYIGIAGEPMIRAIVDRFPNQYENDTPDSMKSSEIFRHN